MKSDFQFLDIISTHSDLGSKNFARILSSGGTFVGMYEYVGPQITLKALEECRGPAA